MNIEHSTFSGEVGMIEGIDEAPDEFYGEEGHDSSWPFSPGTSDATERVPPEIHIPPADGSLEEHRTSNEKKEMGE